MSKKENPPPLVAQEAGQRTENGNISTTNYSKCENKNQGIYDLLPQGEKNAVASKALADMIGVRSVRELQHRVATERAQGALILSTCKGGYFRPSEGVRGQEEIARFVATVRARALNSLKILQGAKMALSGLDGQVEMDDLFVL